MIRVSLPYHLRTLAGVGAEVELEIEGLVTPEGIIDALEAEYPMLRATMREDATGERRAYLRFFACGEDLSHQPMDLQLPGEVSRGEEIFRIVGAIAGG
ncbi:MAG: MoaD/ThiS family protein [Anaerolineae bacterium]|nr:MoaD/ThiS family protein [Anaerolineae bacterium]